LVEDTRIQPQADFAIRCLAGENACPPEDVGGAPGYAWCGGSFDPGRFDRNAVNAALTNVRI
jgi:hypothetical protein